MIFDTDILIWIQRGNKKAAELVNHENDRQISVQTYLELLQNAQSKEQIKWTKEFIRFAGFGVLPFTENIGHRALIYLEEYTLASGLEAGDAIIAATATEHGFKLMSGNAKHYRVIKDLDLVVFRP